jgi:hypothetical protein
MGSQIFPSNGWRKCHPTVWGYYTSRDFFGFNGLPCLSRPMISSNAHFKANHLLQKLLPKEATVRQRQVVCSRRCSHGNSAESEEVTTRDDRRQIRLFLEPPQSLKAERNSVNTAMNFAVLTQSRTWGWTEFIWLRVGTTDELLWARSWAFQFCKRQGISFLTEQWVLKQKSRVFVPERPEAKNGCAGEDEQQFSRQTGWATVSFSRTLHRGVSLLWYYF